MIEPDTSGLSPAWAKLRIISTFIASVLVPVVIAYASQSYTRTLKENEIGIRYVELAVTILQAPPSEQTFHLRNWAIETVNHYSTVPLGTEALSELKTQNLSKLFDQYLRGRNPGNSIRDIRP